MKVIFSIRYAVLAAFIVFLVSYFNANAQLSDYSNLYSSSRNCNVTYQNNTSDWLQVVAGDAATVSANSYRSWYVSTSTFTNAGDAGSINLFPNRVASAMYFTSTVYIAPGLYYHFYCAGDTTIGYWYEKPYYGYEVPTPGTSTTTQETVVNIDLASTTEQLEEIKSINTFGTFVFVFLGIVTWLLYLFKLFGTPKKYDY